MISFSTCLSLTYLTYHGELHLNRVILIRSVLVIMSIDVDYKNGKFIILCTFC